MDVINPVLHRTPGGDETPPAEHARESPPADDTSQKNDPAGTNGAGGFDLADLSGLLSLLGSSNAGSDPPSEPSTPHRCEKTHGSADGQHDDSAVRLLRALSPYLQDTRVLSVDRVIQLLETSRGIRGILHTFGPLLGDLMGGKS